MKQKLVIDTNVLIDNPNVIKKYKDDYNIVLSIITLKELDKLKRNPDISYLVRQAIKAVDEAVSNQWVQVDLQHYDAESPDEKILDSASNSLLLTHDIGMKVIAKSKQISLLDDQEENYDSSYIGYEEILLDNEDLFYKQLPHNKDFMIEEFEEYIGKPTILNCYYILKVESSHSYYLFKRIKDKVIKSPYSEKTFRPTGITHINFLHPEQHAAFDAIMDESTPLVVLQGKIGSSKTLMSIIGSLAQTQELAQKKHARFNKIYITRPPTAIERSLELGFDTGSINNKLQQWLQGFRSNLSFLYNVTEKDQLEDKGNQIYQKYFEPVSLESIQGASFNNAILIVDEMQLLSTNALRQVMSRVAQGSKLILLFDPAQNYGVNRGNEGYRRLLPYLKGNEMISYIHLQNIYRSELTKLVDSMFS